MLMDIEGQQKLARKRFQKKMIVETRLHGQFSENDAYTGFHCSANNNGNRRESIFPFSSEGSARDRDLLTQQPRGDYSNESVPYKIRARLKPHLEREERGTLPPDRNLLRFLCHSAFERSWDPSGSVYVKGSRESFANRARSARSSAIKGSASCESKLFDELLRA